ncbi:TetR/AcrR family transcriptional regulator [Streptomyces sp. BI20]|uniref:TetR/AcrR family transcriptional regulator n=1 Tax=Streptomyces sp. BI20 TaxID=3403460 RepID=UPI003C7360AD
MPATREALLRAAETALALRPWRTVRMTDVAAGAGVSRQTLYNEFGGKEGLARALVRRETARWLDGVDRVLAGPGTPAERLTELADWTLGGAARPLTRVLLTGFDDPALPSCAHAPRPAELVRAVRDRAREALGPLAADRAELGVRLALSCLIAPGPTGPAEMLRLSATNRTTAGR